MEKGAKHPFPTPHQSNFLYIYPLKYVIFAKFITNNHSHKLKLHDTNSSRPPSQFSNYVPNYALLLLGNQYIY